MNISRPLLSIRTERPRPQWSTRIAMAPPRLPPSTATVPQQPQPRMGTVHRVVRPFLPTGEGTGLPNPFHRPHQPRWLHPQPSLPLPHPSTPHKLKVILCFLDTERIFKNHVSTLYVIKAQCRDWYRLKPDFLGSFIVVYLKVQREFTNFDIVFFMRLDNIHSNIIEWLRIWSPLKKFFLVAPKAIVAFRASEPKKQNYAKIDKLSR